MEAFDHASSLPYPYGPSFQLIIDSGKLTFEDEAELRHQLTTHSLKSVSSTKRFVLFASATSILGGSYLSWLKSSGAKWLLLAGAGGLSLLSLNNLLERLVVRRVQQLVHSIDVYSELNRQITRWILDSQMTVRSYQMGKKSHDKLRISLPKCCERLRKNSFVHFRQMFRIFRNSAATILSSGLIKEKSDFTESLICSVPLEEFGESLIYQDDHASLFEATDGFSLQALKSLTGLLDLQISEFLRLFCSSLLTSKLPVVHLAALSTLLASMKKLLDTIRAEYEFERGLAAPERNATKPDEYLFVPPTTLRSLELHLTAALIDLREMTPSFIEEQLAPADEEKLEKVGYHVKCASILLENVKRKSVLGAEGSSVGDVSPSKSDFEITEVTTVVDEFPIEDDIFEAVMREELGVGDDSTSQKFGLLPNYAAQKRQAKVLLEEIRDVLSMRSAQWKERERIARERKGLPPADDDNEEPDTREEAGVEFELSAATKEDGSGSQSSELSAPDPFQLQLFTGLLASDLMAAGDGLKLAKSNEEQFGSDAETDDHRH